MTPSDVQIVTKGVDHRSAEHQWWERYLDHPTASARMIALYGQRYSDFFHDEFQDAGDTVEVGSGPVPVMQTMECRNMLAVDIDDYEGLTKWPILTDVSEVSGNAWDTVLLLNVLDHCADPHKLVGEAQRILKPYGRCLVFCHLGQHGDDRHRTVTLPEIKGWFGDDWLLERSEIRETAGDPPAYLAVYRKKDTPPGLVLKDAVAALEEADAAWSLTCGSLLVAVRTGGFLPWEYDIDFAIFPPSNKTAIIDALNRRGFALWREFDDVLQFTRPDTRLVVDCYFYHRDKDEMWQHVYVKDVPGYEDETLRYVYPAELWHDLEWTYWMGVKCLIPSRAEEILERHYGPDWREPRREWNWARDPLCLSK